jgi:hypothetical protein
MEVAVAFVLASNEDGADVPLSPGLSVLDVAKVSLCCANCAKKLLTSGLIVYFCDEPLTAGQWRV